jgi:hypothetical protein
MRWLGKKTVYSAAAYRWTDCIIIHPQSQTTAGFWVTDGPITSLLITCTHYDLGFAASHALRLSRSQVPLPDFKSQEWIALQKEVWAAAGRRSLRQFMANACYVGLRLSSGVLLVEPSLNGGASGPGRGFRPIPEANLELTDVQDLELLGSTISKAWSSCKPPCLAYDFAQIVR